MSNYYTNRRESSGAGPANVRSGIEDRSAVGFAAVLDREDEDGIAVVAEAHAVVTDAQAQLGRLDVLKALYVAFAGGELAGDGV